MQIVTFTHAINRALTSAVAVVACAAPTCGQAVGDIRVDVTNEGASDFFLTPVWFGFHDGTFDTFNVGEAINLPLNSVSMQELAEDGITTGLTTDFDAAAIAGSVQGVVQGTDMAPPPVNPGETGTTFVTPINSASNRYFSYASMVIPSNDSFIANGNPLAFEVFDAAGNVRGGEFVIQVFGSNIWDAGSEVNDEMGAAFSMLGGTRTDENGVVALQPDGELDDFAGSTTLAGTTISNLIEPNELLATIRISIVPEPSSIALGALGLAAVVGVVRLRR